MKRTYGLLLFFLLIASYIFAQTIDDTWQPMDTALTQFLDEVNTALPDNAVIGGNWSDAYIGQILSVPPHFGLGIATGITRFPVKGLQSAMGLADTDLPIDTAILPNFAVEGKIGGFILPFDIGIRFAMLPTIKYENVSFSYLNFGADIRYALLKESLITPDVSIGAGYYFTTGTIGYTFTANNLENLLTVTDTNIPLDISFQTQVIEAKAEISKSLVIITPYGGISGYTALSHADYSIYNKSNSRTTSDDPLYGVRIFGGASLNLAIVKFDLSGMYNFVTQNWGANIGIRVQI